MIEDLLGRSIQGELLTAKGYAIRRHDTGLFMIYKDHTLWYAERYARNGWWYYNVLVKFQKYKGRRPLFEGDEK